MKLAHVLALALCAACASCATGGASRIARTWEEVSRDGVVDGADMDRLDAALDVETQREDDPWWVGVAQLVGVVLGGGAASTVAAVKVVNRMRDNARRARGEPVAPVPPTAGAG